MKHINIHEFGKGSPLIILHGFPGSAIDWFTVAKLLSTKYHVLVPDLIGWGLSDKSENFDDLWVDSQAKSIIKSLESRNIKKFALLGHDYGGPIALAMIQQRPDMVEKLIIANSTIFAKRKLSAIVSTLTIPVLGNILSYLLISKPFLKIMAKSGIKAGSELPESNSKYEVSSIRVIYSRMLSNLKKYCQPSEDILSTIIAPTLIITCQRDPFVDNSIGKRLQSRIKSSVLKIYPNTGHFPQIENRKELVDDIKVFLT